MSADLSVVLPEIALAVSRDGGADVGVYTTQGRARAA
jgi:hypothetical protein